MVCGILVPQTGIERHSVQVKCAVLTTGPPGKSPVLQLEVTINPFLRPFPAFLPPFPFPSFLPFFFPFIFMNISFIQDLVRTVFYSAA